MTTELKVKSLIKTDCKELNMDIQTNEKVNREIYERYTKDENFRKNQYNKQVHR